MLTLLEHQQAAAEAILRQEELRKTIPALAADKFNALASLYTKPNDVYQAAEIEDAVSYMTTPEWQVIGRALRAEDDALVGQLFKAAMRRVCLKLATDEVADSL